MNRQVQSALDGELAPSALTPQEAEEYRHLNALIGGVLRRVPDETAPDLTSRVLTRISAAEAALPGRRHWRDWLWKPRAIQLQWRPVYALAVVALLTAALAVNAPLSRLWPGSGAAFDRQVLVQFRLEAAQAQAVSLAGDFTDWRPLYTMIQSTPGVWTVVVPLDPGVHEYAFIVDGHLWLADPMAPAVRDGFGGVNSRIAVLTPDGRRPL
jgi:hypothetical protein